MHADNQETSCDIWRRVRSGSGGLIWHLVALLLLTALVLVCFRGMLHGQELVWDDHEYVTACTWLEDLSGPHLRNILLEPWMGNHHPLTMLSLALDQQRSGGDPSAFKTTNLILHGLNVALAYLLLWQIARSRVIALVAAVLFAIHPTRVESVAWISERKDLLFAGFYMAGILAYCGLRSRWWRLAASFPAFLLAAASKPMAISFPVVLLIIDIGRHRPGKRDLLEKTPYLAVSLLLGLVTVRAQEPVIRQVPTLVERGLLSLQALGLYLEKLVWPHPLAVLYPRPHQVAVGPEVLLGAVLVAAAILAGIVGIGRAARAGRSTGAGLAASGLLIFLALIGPVLHLVTFGDQLAADRYTYLSYLPLFALVGASVAWLMRRRRACGVVLMLLAGMAVPLIMLTTERVKVWKNDRTLFSSLLRYDPTSPLGHTWLGVVARGEGDLLAAEQHFRAALEADPEDPHALLDLALIERDRGQFEQARSKLEKVVSLQPSWNHAWVYLGQIDFRLGRIDASRRAYERAIEAEPEAAIAWIGLATHAVREGDLDRALDLVRKALEIRPRSWRSVERSPLLAPLRRRPECGRLVSEAKKRDETLEKR